MAEKRGRGRPRKEIDKKQFESLCEIHCTLEEIASVFSCDTKTLETWCKREYDGLNFSDVYKRFSSYGNKSLRRWQFEHAKRSVPMAIFLGKNWLGQTDKQETTYQEVEDLTPLSEMLNGEDTED